MNSQNFIGKVKLAIPEIGVLLIPPFTYILLGAIVSAVAIVIFIYERKRRM